MLIRQYSIRTLLKVTALCAVLSLFFHYAWSGSPWAVCLVIAMIGLIIFFLVQSLAFLVLWSISSSAGAVRQSSSPFASNDASRSTGKAAEIPTGPKETEPKETGPKETEPKETEPKETEPKETEPKETGPKETGPKENETGAEAIPEKNPSPDASTGEEEAKG